MADGAVIEPASRLLHVLQIGMEWFTAAGGGGVSRFYGELFRALGPEQGVRLSGLVSSPDDVGHLTAGRVRSFAPQGASMPTRLLGARRAVTRALQAERFDAIACHFALYGAPSLDHFRRHPLIVHFQGPWAAESRAEGQRKTAVLGKHLVERLVYGRATRMIVLSEAFAHIAEHDYRVPRDRLRIVPASVDLGRFAVPLSREDARRVLGWPIDRPILLSVRRLASRMGLDRLLDAMVRIRQAVPETLLCIAGHGPLMKRLYGQAEALGLHGNVRFLGFLPDADLPYAYRAADVNVLPTRALEGFGLSAAEALASGTPSMVTPVGGLPEVVEELSPDLVFRSVLVEDIAEGLRAALRGGIELPDADACRRYAEARFDPALCARRIAAVYREAV